MQEFNENEKLLRTLIEDLETLGKEPAHPQAARRVIAELPKPGSHLEINGLLYVVKYSDRRGNVHLVLQEPAGNCSACHGYGYRLRDQGHPKCETCDGTGFHNEQ